MGLKNDTIFQHFNAFSVSAGKLLALEKQGQGGMG